MRPLIHTGNCVPFLRRMADRSVDHFLFDPPYDEHVHANAARQKRKADKVKHDTIAKTDLEFVSLDPKLQRNVAIECGRLARRWVLVFCHVEIVHSWREALEAAGLRYVRTLIWHKLRSSPQFSGDRPAANYETIVVAHAKKTRMRWNAGGMGAVYTHEIVTGVAARDRINKTEKPLPLILDLVRDFTDPGELIVDPFAGSGSTGIAARRMGRKFLGCELRKAQARDANERLEADRVSLSLRDRRRGQLSLLERTA